MTPARSTHILRMAAGLTLIALALIVASLIAPDPIPVVLSMSVGQVIGTCAFLLYLLVIVADLRAARVLARSRRGNGT